MVKLLHIEKNIPVKVLEKVANIQKTIDVSKIFLSRHIQEHLDKGDHKHSYDKEGLLSCVQSLKDEPIDPFEVEVDIRPDNSFSVTKYVVRIPYSNTHDISVSIRGNKIITAWLNRFDDIHYTLDLSKYDEGF
jgi:hypothetical protein